MVMAPSIFWSYSAIWPTDLYCWIIPHGYAEEPGPEDADVDKIAEEGDKFRYSTLCPVLTGPGLWENFYAMHQA